MPYRFLATVFVALWLPAAATSAADFQSQLLPGDQMTATAGGSGGTPFVLRCKQGSYLMGVKVQKVAWIHYVEPQCEIVAFDAGAFHRGPGLAQFSTGGAGKFDTENGAASARCRDTEFVAFGLFPTRVVAPSGTFLGTFTMACRRMINAFEQEGDSFFHSVHIDPAANANYVSLGALACDNGQWAVGIHGRAGLFVDNMGLVCGAQPVRLNSRINDPSIDVIAKPIVGIRTRPRPNLNLMAPAFGGTWTVSSDKPWGYRMTFTQSGTAVTGTYVVDVNGAAGRISGNVIDDVLSFTWDQDGGYTGDGSVRLSADRKSFAGNYRVNDNGTLRADLLTGKWTGTRN